MRERMRDAATPVAAAARHDEPGALASVPAMASMLTSMAFLFSPSLYVNDAMVG